MLQGSRFKGVLRIFIWVALAAEFLVLIGPVATVDSEHAALHDFLAYWTATRLNMTGGNPYASDQVLRLEQQIGWTDATALMSWNPPWTMALLIPFGAIDFNSSRLAWSALCLLTIMACSAWLWKYYGGTRRFRWLALFLTVVFVPTVFSLSYGQVTPIVLLGIVGFLWQTRRDRLWLAGAALALTAIKPHDLYMLWIAVFLWCLDHRRWQLLAGAAASCLAATLIAAAINPLVISQYLHISSTSDLVPLNWPTPTLGTLLRARFGITNTWLQFVPAVVGVSWLLVYYRRRRATWEWGTQAPILLLVSAVTSFFGWTFDLIVLVVPLLQMAARLEQRRREFLMGSIVLPGVALGLRVWGLDEISLFWLAPLLLLLYVVLDQRARRAEAYPASLLS